MSYSSYTDIEKAQTEPSFGLYANFFGTDNTFSDEETIATGAYGIKTGNVYIHDKSTGEIKMIGGFLKGFGDLNIGNTILYGDSITLDYGRVLRCSFTTTPYVHSFKVGLCKSDLSNCGTSPVRIDSEVNGHKIEIPYYRSLEELFEYTEYEIMFILGGFDINGNAYNGGNKDGYVFGYYAFIRSAIRPYWFLMGVLTVDTATLVTPYFAFYGTNTSPYRQTPLIKLMTYSIPSNEIIPTGKIELSSDDLFNGFDVNNTMLFFRTNVADGEEINLYFCIDDYVTPTNGYRLKMARSTNSVFTMYQIDSGIETTLATSQELAGGERTIIFTLYKGLLWGDHPLLNFANLDVSAHSTNTLAKIVNGANSFLYNFVWYPLGANGEYREKLRIQEPFFVGDEAPGYGLPDEARKGHYFDVSSQSQSWGVESIGVVAYLVNGSDKMRVRYRSHTEQRWVPELDVVLNLRFAYSGTDAVIYIGSDPHFGYINQDGTLNYQYQIIPDLQEIDATHCFILGDIVHDVDVYDDYIAAKGLYPTAVWKELNGNHDIVGTFKTKLGYDDESHVEIIGNCVFIMCGSSSTNTTIDHTFLGNSLDAYNTSNCFIMTHAGRLNTTFYTDIAPAVDSASIETVVESKKFVAWFAGHQHGWEKGTRQLKKSMYLNLGDNN